VCEIDCALIERFWFVAPSFERRDRPQDEELAVPHGEEHGNAVSTRTMLARASISLNAGLANKFRPVVVFRT